MANGLDAGDLAAFAGTADERTGGLLEEIGWSERVGADAAIEPVTNAPSATAFNTNLLTRSTLQIGSSIVTS